MALRPGSGATPGGYLFSKLAALSDKNVGASEGVSFENQVVQLQSQSGGCVGSATSPIMNLWNG
jgi:hypothetical protein